MVDHQRRESRKRHLSKFVFGNFDPLLVISVVYSVRTYKCVGMDVLAACVHSKFLTKMS